MAHLPPFSALVWVCLGSGSLGPPVPARAAALHLVTPRRLCFCGCLVNCVSRMSYGPCVLRLACGRGAGYKPCVRFQHVQTMMMKRGQLAALVRGLGSLGLLLALCADG